MESEWEYDNEWIEAAFDNEIRERETGHELIDSLDQLIQYAMIPEERKELLYKLIFTMSFEDAVNLYLELKDKQVNRIHAGINYNMTYIKDFMKKSI